MADAALVMSVKALKKLVDKVARRRYQISGDDFIDAVTGGTSIDQFPGSEDLTELVRKYIL